MKNKRNLFSSIEYFVDNINEISDSDTDVEYKEYQEMKDILSSSRQKFLNL